MIFLDMAASLDGYISGPQGEDGGLHDWYFAEGAAETIKTELLARIGAIILGHRAFGDDPGGFDTPYKVPHFILSHQPRKAAERGGASFTFVPHLEAALEQAREAAGDRDVCVAGGAEIARQFLAAGLLDELHLHVAPVLLGGGRRLFGEGGMIPLERVRVSESKHATHLVYRVRP
jgi:dihydrofolate reductase